MQLGDETDANSNPTVVAAVLTGHSAVISMLLPICIGILKSSLLVPSLYRQDDQEWRLQYDLPFREMPASAHCVADIMLNPSLLV